MPAEMKAWFDNLDDENTFFVITAPTNILKI